MLQAGAAFKGKTITDELAYSLHGQNKHYETLVNPVAPAHIPGGSSSGSAVAVSAHLADIGLGTDTGGSIRVPSSYQGLWGLRPTHGVVACDNMVALAPSFDTVGWMTRDLNTLTKVANVCIDSATQSEISGSPRFGIAAHLSSRLPTNRCAKHGLQRWLITTTVLYCQRQPDLKTLQTAATFRTLQGNEIWHNTANGLNTLNPISPKI